MAIIIIPTPLRKFTNDNDKITVIASTIEQAFELLTENFPALRKYLYSESSISGFLNVFVEDEDIRDLNNENTRLEDNSIVHIVPAIAGG